MGGCRQGRQQRRDNCSVPRRLSAVSPSLPCLTSNLFPHFSLPPLLLLLLSCFQQPNGSPGSQPDARGTLVFSGSIKQAAAVISTEQSSSLSSLAKSFNLSNAPDGWKCGEVADVDSAECLATCDDDGFVVTLSVLGNKDANNISIPTELFQLTRLVDLELNAITFGGSLPDDFKTLTGLSRLSLSGNRLNGSFPSVCFSLPNLNHLDLESNLFNETIPSTVSQLTGLTFLNLSGNKFTGGIPPAIGNLTNLKSLALKDNLGIGGSIPSELGNLRQLQLLFLFKTNLSGELPPSLGNLGNLQQLKFQNSNISGSFPASFSGLQNLTHIHVARTKISGSIPALFGALPELFSVHFEETDMSGPLPEELGRAKSLQNIYLDNSDFYGPLPKCWSNLPDLGLISPYTNFSCPPLASKSTRSSLCCTTGSSNSIATVQMNNSFCNQQGLCPDYCNSCLKKSALSPAVLAAIIISAFVLTSAIIFALYAFYQYRVKTKGNWENKLRSTTFRKFTLAEMRRATNDFDESRIVGKGGFAMVYAGEIGGAKVAVKKATNTETDEDKVFFISELMSMSNISHQNLVRILGYCSEAKEQILVYELITNGSLGDHLYETCEEHVLDLYERIIAIIGIAEGLNYLHNFVTPPMIHRDIKPSNILLDERWQPKVADFGLVKAMKERGGKTNTSPVGTRGYTDPEYLVGGNVGPKSDIYSFGVVLLEIITGKEAIFPDPTDPEEKIHIAKWVLPLISDKRVADFADRRVFAREDMDTCYTFAQLAEQCLAPYEKRPDMQQILPKLRVAKLAYEKKHGLSSFASENPSQVVPIDEEEGQRPHGPSSSSAPLLLHEDAHSTVLF